MRHDDSKLESGRVEEELVAMRTLLRTFIAERVADVEEKRQINRQMNLLFNRIEKAIQPGRTTIDIRKLVKSISESQPIVPRDPLRQRIARIGRAQPGISKLRRDRRDPRSKLPGSKI